MRGTVAIWGIAAASLMLAGCMATPTQRKAKNLWDMNYLSRMGSPISPTPLQPKHRSDAVPNRAGSAAIWVHPTDSSKSLILAMDASRQGGLYAFDITGITVQQIPNIRLGYGLAIARGFQFGRRQIDIAVTVERDRQRLRVFGINPGKRKLWEIGGDLKIFADQQGNDAAGMSLALHRTTDGKTFALVGRKRNDSTSGLVEVYELKAKDGRLSVKPIRELGDFGRRGTVRNLLVDDFYGSLFYYDETVGIRKYKIFPSSDAERSMQSAFSADGWVGLCGALAIRPGERPGLGFILAADQQNDRTTLRFYRRQGELDRPELHRLESQIAVLSARDVTTMDIATQPMPGYPEGMLVVNNGYNMTFEFYSWRDVRTQYAATLHNR